MCACLVTNEHDRVVTVQYFDLLFKVIYKNGKAFQGHLRQDQTDQITRGRCQGTVQITKLIPQLYPAHRSVALGGPAAFVLGAGATAQLAISKYVRLP